MPVDANSSARRSERLPARLWLRTPIRHKLGLMTALIVLTLGLMLYLSLVQSRHLMQTAYTQESDYYNINGIQNLLLETDTGLQAWLRSPADSADCVDSVCTGLRQLRSQIRLLNQNWNEVGVERAVLARAISVGFEPYAGQVNALFALWEGGEATMPALYAQYDVITATGGYLLQTVRSLQSEALTEGQSRMADLRVENTQRSNLFTLLAVLVCILLAALVRELVHCIVTPVLRMSEASKAIGEGRFDVPDVEVDNRDEIYTLALAFNHMKHSMKRLFTAMQEKTDMEQRLYQKELEASESRRLMEQARMQQLRNQINPHFLFNTLNIISRTARREKAADTEKLILALARLFRYSLKTDDTEVPLAREMRIINDYISIQSRRFENRVALQWRVAPEVDPESILTPAFVMQPIVENAVIHGLEPKVDGGIIRIRIHLRQDILTIRISDNGVGMNADAVRRMMTQQTAHGDVSGIGIGNVRSRLQMLYPDGNMKILSKEGRGTSVCITLPHPHSAGLFGMPPAAVPGGGEAHAQS